MRRASDRHPVPRNRRDRAPRSRGLGDGSAIQHERGERDRALAVVAGSHGFARRSTESLREQLPAAEVVGARPRPPPRRGAAPPRSWCRPARSRPAAAAARRSTARSSPRHAQPTQLPVRSPSSSRSALIPIWIEYSARIAPHPIETTAQRRRSEAEDRGRGTRRRGDPLVAAHRRVDELRSVRLSSGSEGPSADQSDADQERGDRRGKLPGPVDRDREGTDQEDSEHRTGGRPGRRPGPAQIRRTAQNGRTSTVSISRPPPRPSSANASIGAECAFRTATGRSPCRFQ